MKRLTKSALIISAVCFFFCNDIEYSYYQPPNPPSGIMLNKTGDDYLLLFRSENRNNARFGGFLIFIDESSLVLSARADFENMSSADQDAFTGSAGYILSGGKFNTGIDAEIAVIFSDTSELSEGSIIEYNGSAYTVKTALDKNKIIPGHYLSLRTYLIGPDYSIIAVSNAGNIVQIGQ